MKRTMGRLTKRNRAKYRRRAYAAAALSVDGPAPRTVQFQHGNAGKTRIGREADDRRAA